MLMTRFNPRLLSVLSVLAVLSTGCAKGDDGPTGACVESNSGVVEGNAGSTLQGTCVDGVNQTACDAGSTSDGEYETTTEFFEGQSCDELQS